MKVDRTARALVLIASALLLVASAPVQAAIYIVSPATDIDLDGNASTDIQYFLASGTLPAISPRNGSGWAYGLNSGLSTSNWVQQTYSDATMQSYNTAVGGFGFNGTYDPKYVWSTHLEVFLIKTSAGHYYKLRCNAIDQADLNPITLEIEELVCVDMTAPTVTSPASATVRQTICN